MLTMTSATSDLTAIGMVTVFSLGVNPGRDDSVCWVCDCDAQNSRWERRPLVPSRDFHRNTVWHLLHVTNGTDSLSNRTNWNDFHTSLLPSFFWYTKRSLFNFTSFCSAVLSMLSLILASVNYINNNSHRVYNNILWLIPFTGSDGQ